ncbi:hypothetical protein I4U23_026652 [Adineta vaga]|nr:hypothetical protein I4U23_026652 [Adineta vaga]
MRLVLYPDCEIFGRFIDFKQCIWRHICSLHNENSADLAFIPPQNVIKEFEKTPDDVVDNGIPSVPQSQLPVSPHIRFYYL